MNNEEKILTMLEQMQKQLTGLETKVDGLETKVGGLEVKLDGLETKVDEGFDRLENLINVAAKDAARTEKRLNEHLKHQIA